MNNKLVKECINKSAINQVLGCLMKDSDLLNQYRLTKKDLEEDFFDVIYSAIGELSYNGAKTLTPALVDQRITDCGNKDAIDNYNKNDGKEYLLGIYKRADISNFGYYYETVKKFSFLRELARKGFSIKEFYNPRETDENKIKETRENINSYTVKQLIDYYKDKMNSVTSVFNPPQEGDSIHAGDDLIENIEKWKLGNLYGVPYASEFFTEVTRGLKEGRFTLLSAGTGVGKVV